MYYKEYLRARGALFVFIIVAAILLVLSFAGMVLTNSVNSTPDTIPWPALLAVAGFAATIMATILGSTLSQENDGHLELACTKPHSRTQYAATAIAIDLAAILATQLIGFAFILIHIIFVHPAERLVSGPDAGVNTLRFILFPLAWYAIIAAFSAGLRGKAGIVQGLIWPVTLVLVVLREVPLSMPWHSLFVVINVINPLVYISYQDASDVKIIGASPAHVVASAMMLLALLIVGWVAATVQWRRVEA